MSLLSTQDYSCPQFTSLGHPDVHRGNARADFSGHRAQLGSVQAQLGQTALFMVLLLLALGTTLGLVVSSRSTTDVDLSSRIEREAAVYSANEAGVERILALPLAAGATQNFTINTVDVTARDITVNSAGVETVIPGVVDQGTTYAVWLAGHTTAPLYAVDESSSFSPSNTVDLCWSRDPNITTGSTPAIVASILYKESGTGDYKITRAAYRDGSSNAAPPCGTSASTGDCFEHVAPTSNTWCTNTNTTNPSYIKQISFASLGVGAADTLISLRIRPVNVSVKLAVLPNGQALPRQAINYAEVTARQQNTEESTRIRVFQSYPTALSMFDYALFSGGDL